jgi:ankyrin repeat protein
MKASQEGRTAVVQLLLEAGADTEAKSKVREKDYSRLRAIYYTHHFLLF